jgi:surface antigen
MALSGNFFSGIYFTDNLTACSTATSVILSGGALAKNIFWQVAGQVTVGTSAHFEGIILGKTGVNFQTSASMNGRIMAQTMVTFDDNAIVEPAD